MNQPPFVFINFTYEQLINLYTKEELIELYNNKYIIFTDLYENDEGKNFKDIFEKKIFND